MHAIMTVQWMTYNWILYNGACPTGSNRDEHPGLSFGPMWGLELLDKVVQGVHQPARWRSRAHARHPLI